MKLERLPLLLIAFAALQAQDHGSITDSPFSSPRDRLDGAALFRTACAACHGLLGAGGSNGPSLTKGSFKHGASDEALFRAITKGIPHTPMTPFAFEGREVWQLISFIRYVNVGKGAEQSKGDPVNGAKIFAAQGCGRCHSGFMAPDLTQIGLRRSLEQLERAVVDPDAEVAPEYWSLRARTKSGQTVSGTRLNEDMDSFQIREPSGQLRSLWKSDLASYEIVHSSPMPAFKNKLQPRELEDLIAYLASLKAGASLKEEEVR
jgi:putative heme-binding domain-containing protein